MIKIVTIGSDINVWTLEIA